MKTLANKLNLTPSLPDYWPMCDVCNRPVDRMVWETDPSTNTVIAKAFCHGKRQNTILVHHDFQHGPLKLYGTTAFMVTHDLLPHRRD